MIIDALSGRPIEGARVKAEWWCYDSPDPHLGNYWIHISVTSDENGYYKLKRPNRRAGWFGGSFSLHVNAQGYVPVVVVTPDKPPLPLSTQTYPFIDTRAYASLPKSMDIRLNPFKPRLLKALMSENTQYRWRAAEELGKIGHDAKDAVPALIVALNDEDKEVRLSAIDALGTIGADDGAISALINLLSDQDRSVRTHAIRSLARFGPKAKAAVPILKAILGQNSINNHFRNEVEYALKNIDPHTLDNSSTQ
jgi:hypothetical protein